jgi:hypothetical protein
VDPDGWDLIAPASQWAWKSTKDVFTLGRPSPGALGALGASLLAWGVYGGFSWLYETAKKDLLCAVENIAHRLKCQERKTACLHTDLDQWIIGTEGTTYCEACYDECMRRKGLWPGKFDHEFFGEVWCK